MEKTKHLYIPILVLILIYILLGCFLFSFENYPVDDDWSYIKIAETFHHTGKMQFTPWTAMSLVFQVWWGTCFTKLFGYSIEILRLSTLVISLLGLIFIYLLLQELKHHWQTSLFVVLLILFNPFSFPLNFTFFTDHFFISLLFISTYFYYKAFKDDKDIYLFIASLVASFSVLVRQNGILIPLSVFVYLLISKRSFKTIIRRGLITLVIPLATFIVFTYWLNAIHGPTAEYIKQTDKLLENLRKPYLLLIKIGWRPFLILEFMGFCLLPLSFSFLPKVKELFNRKNYFLLLLFCLAGTVFFLAFEHIGLYSSVDLLRNGFRFAYISEYGFRDFLNILFFFYRVLAFLAVASIVYLIYLLIKYRKSIREKFNLASPTFLILCIGIFQLLFLLTTLHKFSRYYLILIPFFVFFILEISRYMSINKKVFIPLLTAYTLLSFAITQDFMSWNQLKWQAASQLKDKGIPLQKTSAGFAWDAWHNCQYSLDHPYEITPQRGDVPWWIEDLTPVIDPQYLISNSPVPTGFEFFNYFDTDRYDTIDSFNYFSLFFLRKMKIYMLQRAPRTNIQPEGFLFLDFLSNLKGARIKSNKETDEITQVSVDLGGIKKDAWLQYSPSSVSFKVQLPHGRCRLKTALGMMPSCWDKPGNGVLCKILIDAILLENLFHVTGSIGIVQERQFFMPKTYFFEPRTYFIQFIDPKNNLAERKWQEISLDLSTFAGKFVDITFEVGEVDSAPKKDGRNDEALWAQPVIESY
ncbi:MAG: glycosyltransferase family 39 protein [Deltaproteobacteria bacterium]|nr:glycosyltransferase family 39 protein [Deltaproteobacteria bacterium]